MADLEGPDPVKSTRETLGHMIHIPGRDGTFKAYFAPAAHQDPAPCVLVCQEIFGINKEMWRICENLSQMGYSAICPDLFWRIDPGIELDPTNEQEMQKAFDLFGKFDIDKGLQDIQDTITHARTLKETTGKVGAIGYCLGGLLAYLTACRTDADCAVGYYGVNIDKYLDECKGITKPLMLHIAGNDEFVSKEQQETVIEGLQGNSHVTTYHYPGAPHAFARQTDAGHYKEDAATEANRRTEEFLLKHLKHS
ncbi:Dienelactone hydrolase family [Caenispirillum salinarum AK4]|uniref:Dienelactone hydrolase family n=1 Tax=Caenispirillum salinarum AK4 TaxID=1238182 RepID=K9H7P1_9PROT|nr:dienelactone hydrolase family protein [Caenispirillum salinarum]EKV26598.1 Dienelactone hydrolase family [Caenispirillum salinarum AK4]